MYKKEGCQTDEELMLLYKGGHFTSFETLYRRYDQQILGFLIRQTNYRKQDAIEIAQEVWLALIRTSQTYEIKSTFRTYIFTIVHNKYIDFYRKNRSHSEFFLFQEDLDTVGSDVSGVEESFIRTEEVQSIDYILQSLADHHREILVYRYVEDLTVPEIAIILQIPLERAKSKLRYAKAAFKESYLKHYKVDI